MNEITTDYRNQVNASLKEELTKASGSSELLEAMAYSVNAGGKRIRPLLTLATAQLFGANVTSEMIKVAAAVELMHTYSLIHDDLPAMDNDTLRRGKPTNHVRFGEALAILAGDALQPLAFSWLVDNNLPGQTKVALVQEMATAAGPAGMVAGQVADILGEAKTYSESALQRLHEQKTGALLAYSVVAGGILTEQPATIIEQLRSLGIKYGLAFQIKDDINDMTRTSADLGKTAAKDANEHKNTYVTLLGLNGARKKLAETVADLRRSLAAIVAVSTGDPTTIIDLLKYFDEDDGCKNNA